MNRFTAELQILGFIKRNPGWSSKNIRQLSVVRKAMRDYALDASQCEFFGCRSRYRYNPQVHHILSVAQHPQLAASWSNLIALCKCHHFTVGHGCSYHQVVRNVREICDSVEIVP